MTTATPPLKDSRSNRMGSRCTLTDDDTRSPFASDNDCSVGRPSQAVVSNATAREGRLPTPHSAHCTLLRFPANCQQSASLLTVWLIRVIDGCLGLFGVVYSTVSAQVARAGPQPMLADAKSSKLQVIVFLESQGIRCLSNGIQGQAEAVVVRAVRRFVRVQPDPGPTRFSQL